MLLRNLGSSYLCLDRLSTIKFLKPGKGTLYAQFELARDEIEAVKTLVADHGRTDRQYLVELRDASGVVCGEVTCTVHVRLKAEK